MSIHLYDSTVKVTNEEYDPLTAHREIHMMNVRIHPKSTGMGLENPAWYPGFTAFQQAGYFTPLKDYVPLSDNPDNKFGQEMERKGGYIVQSRPYVTNVAVVTKGSLVDTLRQDLFVTIDPGKARETFGIDAFVIDSVSIQVKASSRGAREFRDRMHRLGIPPSDRKKWMWEQRCILLITDHKTNHHSKKRRMLCDDDIIADFETQLRAINEYALTHVQVYP